MIIRGTLDECQVGEYVGKEVLMKEARKHMTRGGKEIDPPPTKVAIPVHNPDIKDGATLYTMEFERRVKTRLLKTDYYKRVK